MEQAAHTTHDPFTRRSGVVKWFNSKSLFGFIKDDATGEDYYVNSRDISSCLHPEPHSLRNGEAVEFSTKPTTKGTKAVYVTGPNGRPTTGSRSGSGSGSRTTTPISTLPTNQKTDLLSVCVRVSIALASAGVGDLHNILPAVLKENDFPGIKLPANICQGFTPPPPPPQPPRNAPRRRLDLPSPLNRGNCNNLTTRETTPPAPQEPTQPTPPSPTPAEEDAERNNREEEDVGKEQEEEDTDDNEDVDVEGEEKNDAEEEDVAEEEDDEDEEVEMKNFSDEYVDTILNPSMELLNHLLDGGKPPSSCKKKQDLSHIPEEEKRTNQETKNKYPNFYHRLEYYCTIQEFYPTLHLQTRHIPPHLHRIFCPDVSTALKMEPHKDEDEAFLPSTTPSNPSPALTRQQKKMAHRHK